MSVRKRRSLRRFSVASLLSVASILPAFAAEVHGRVTDPLGAPVAGAQLALIEGGKIVGSGRSAADGSYSLHTGQAGQFYIVVVSQTFRQISTPAFYAGVLDSHQQNVVLEPARINQHVVVTATGTPTPQAQVSGAITSVPQPDFRNRAIITDALRQAPGIFLVQQGMYGGLTSLFVRGGNSAANRVVLDGVPIENIGGVFDYSTLATTGIKNFEIYRGANSTLYGADAAAGVVNLETPRGTTSFPSLLYEGDAGNFHTYRNAVQAGGTWHKLDYYGGFDALRSSNALPQDEYHLNTETVNLGYAISGATSLRVTARNADAAVGLPGPYNFTALTNDGKQSDQNIYLSGTIENQTTEAWHNLVRYGLTRKREQTAQWYPAGVPITFDSGGIPYTNYYGLPVLIRGANGYNATGQALMNYGTDFGGVYPNSSDSANNRDQLYFQSDFRFTPHLSGLLGFRYMDERGSYSNPAYFLTQQLERTNYDYIGQFTGDFKNRLFYALSGVIEKNQLYGTVGEPRVGLAYFPVRPGAGIAHGTKLTFNFSKGIQEPDLNSQLQSLQGILAQYGYTDLIAKYSIGPVGGETSRSYDGGVEQTFFNERLLLKALYFHNEFGNQIEFVDGGTLPLLGVSPTVAAAVENTYGGASVNSLAFRAQGAEVELESEISSHIFARGGYTYTDGATQRSFSSDAIGPQVNPFFPGVELGINSPLIGARPFRRPPHVGFATVTYTTPKWFLQVQGSFASRSDDSTFLSSFDSLAGDNSLLLPNRNLDAAYAKVDTGGSYQFKQWIAVYAQLDNLVSDQHIGPIGYPSLPFTFRAGMRFAIGHTKK
ncbi:MAG TPA: TonB-dependent receptor [Acidobacteriaceae bacterium]|jgi:iron complex outermembrane receptor protein/vitamin B12 transporter